MLGATMTHPILSGTLVVIALALAGCSTTGKVAPVKEAPASERLSSIVLITPAVSADRSGGWQPQTIALLDKIAAELQRTLQSRGTRVSRVALSADTPRSSSRIMALAGEAAADHLVEIRPASVSGYPDGRIVSLDFEFIVYNPATKKQVLRDRFSTTPQSSAAELARQMVARLRGNGLLDK